MPQVGLFNVRHLSRVSQNVPLSNSQKSTKLQILFQFLVAVAGAQCRRGRPERRCMEIGWGGGWVSSLLRRSPDSAFVVLQGQERERESKHSSKPFPSPLTCQSSHGDRFSMFSSWLLGETGSLVQSKRSWDTLGEYSERHIESRPTPSKSRPPPSLFPLILHWPLSQTPNPHKTNSPTPHARGVRGGSFSGTGIGGSNLISGQAWPPRG